MADIAIVGAGPAGLACAIALAERGESVVVFEPRALPIDKPCGEGIMPEGVAHLKELGAFSYINRRDSSFFNGVCFINEKGQRAQSYFRNAYGLGCRRVALSAALLRRCQEFSSIQIVSEKIIAIKRAKKCITLVRAGACDDMRVLIGADGLRSRIRQWAFLDGGEAPINRYGLRKHFAKKPWSNQVEVYFARGIEAYITPCGIKQTNVTFLWSKDLLRHRSEDVSFASLLEHFPDLKVRLQRSVATSEQRATGPLYRRCTDVISDALALIGDASGYFDAITGEGISIALAQATALAHVIAQAPKILLTRRHLAPYARAHRSITRAYYRNTALLLWCARRPTLMSTLIALGHAQPRAFGWMIEASRSL